MNRVDIKNGAAPKAEPSEQRGAFSPREIVSELDRFIVGQNARLMVRRWAFDQGQDQFSVCAGTGLWPDSRLKAGTGRNAERTVISAWSNKPTRSKARAPIKLLSVSSG